MIQNGANTPLSRAFKKTKINESGDYTSSSNADTSFEIDRNEDEIRPIGQKAANEKAKKKKKSKAAEQCNNEGWDQKWAAIKEWREEKLAKIKSMKQGYELQADHQILTMDTSHMNAEQLENHRFMCSIIKSKYKN